MNKTILIAALSLSFTLSARKELEVKYIRNYDGDTFYVQIPSLKKYDRRKNLTFFWDEISVRVAGIDTPEIRGSACDNERELAYKARDIVDSLFRAAHHIKLRNIAKDKYFRLLADVDIDGESLSALLIDKGYAIPYDGGTKTNPWCKRRH